MREERENERDRRERREKEEKERGERAYAVHHKVTTGGLVYSHNYIHSFPRLCGNFSFTPILL